MTAAAPSEIWDDEPADRQLAQYDQLDDLVATTGQVFLGLTVDCARCHDQHAAEDQRLRW